MTLLKFWVGGKGFVGAKSAEASHKLTAPLQINDRQCVSEDGVVGEIRRASAPTMRPASTAVINVIRKRTLGMAARSDWDAQRKADEDFRHFTHTLDRAPIVHAVIGGIDSLFQYVPCIHSTDEWRSCFKGQFFHAVRDLCVTTRVEEAIGDILF